MQRHKRSWPHGYVDPRTRRSVSKAAALGPLAGSPGSRRRPAGIGKGGPEPRETGVALVVVMTVVAILTIFLAELLQNTTTAFHVSVSERDKVKAEYLAKSGLNLTRLLIAKEPEIRRVVAPIYQMAFGRRPPQLNVWDFADTIFAPFSDPSLAEEIGATGGIDFGQMEGLTETGGVFQVVAIPENSMINISKPLFLAGDQAKTSIAMQFYSLMGGYQSPDSPYDVMFSQADPDGNFSTRLDVVAAAIDWWDFDEQRTIFDPGASAITQAGSEDGVYQQFREPYQAKNAAYDSLEELRLIRGVGEDFWASFVESDPNDPKSRRVTIYGSGSVNPNNGRPEVLLARLCSFVTTQPLCLNAAQQSSFMMLFNTARSMAPIAIFTRAEDFLLFVEGKGGPKDLYPTVMGLLGPDNPLLQWTPIVIPQDQRRQIGSAFITSAAIFTIQTSGRVGRAETKMTAVVNFDPRWVPPAGVPATPPPLGVLHHYRMD